MGQKFNSLCCCKYSSKSLFGKIQKLLNAKIFHFWASFVKRDTLEILAPLACHAFSYKITHVQAPYPLLSPTTGPHFLKGKARFSIQDKSGNF